MVACPTAADSHSHKGVVSAPELRIALDVEAPEFLEEVLGVARLLLQVGILDVEVDVHLERHQTGALQLHGDLAPGVPRRVLKGGGAEEGMRLSSGVPLEEVGSFICLGSSFTAFGQAKDVIKERIGLTRSSFSRLKSALWSRRETKGRIYEALIRTILLYGCETWPVRAEDLRRLEVFDNNRLRQRPLRRTSSTPLSLI